MRILFLAICSFFMLQSCATQTNKASTNTKSPLSWEEAKEVAFDGKKIEKTEEEWKETLSAEEFRILRNHGTEYAFSGALLENKKDGIYTCAACQLPLFSSTTKFKSGTGWPSFYEKIHTDNVGETVDNSHGMSRTEVHCNRCGGHLGHVFNDGPEPTGLRYCINSVSLNFVEKKKD